MATANGVESAGAPDLPAAAHGCTDCTAGGDPKAPAILAIFSEPNFGGTNATATDEQPNLGENGWQNQIASVQVKSGTWDLFSDQQFTGETMRLAPGSYADLGPQWTKRAGLVHVRAAGSRAVGRWLVLTATHRL